MSLVIFNKPPRTLLLSHVPAGLRFMSRYAQLQSYPVKKGGNYTLNCPMTKEKHNPKPKKIKQIPHTNVLKCIA